MTGTLAFVGGGAFTEGCTFDRDLFAASGAEEVLLLTTAAAFENPAKVAERATAWFGGLGAAVHVLPVLQRAEANDDLHAARMREARFVYLPGSSPLHLRSVLAESGVWAALVAAWNAGATVVAAGEAASGLADPMLDPRGGAFGIGLGLVAGMAVLPHAEVDGADLAEHHRRTFELADADLPVAAVPDCTALVRSGDGAWSAVGAGAVRVFVNGAERGLDALP
jgi:cyanophycinase